MTVNKKQFAALPDEERRLLIASLMAPKIAHLVSELRKPEGHASAILDMLMQTEQNDLLAMLESPETLAYVVGEAVKVVDSGDTKKGCTIA